MTPVEYAAWIRGVNTALNGAMPSKELWAEVVKQAQTIAPAYAPPSLLPDVFKPKPIVGDEQKRYWLNQGAAP